MKKVAVLLSDSYKELKNVKSLTLIAMFGAISIILGYFTLVIGDFLKVGFSFLPNQFIYYLFGPIVGAVFGAAMDILTFFIRPTGSFFWGFTLNAILEGFIYGFALYRKPLTMKRIFLINILDVILVKLVLTTYWLSILYGNGFFTILPIRALKALIMLPIETILLFTIIKGVEATGIFKPLNDKKFD
ncbi:MAG: hypothetical protein K0R92_1611 [Lachnospiraceae bacterium]|jgi:ECF transporter S component (folate family)|nr:hypothetical protein [Lachnospiraceae bacterium]